jgi:hypothetical protein
MVGSRLPLEELASILDPVVFRFKEQQAIFMGGSESGEHLRYDPTVCLGFCPCFKSPLFSANCKRR